MNRILVTGALSDREYAAIQTETGFLFHCCSNLNGFDEREFQRSVSSPGPKDIVIDRIQILSKDLREYSPFESNAGRFRIRLYTSDGKCHQFFIGAKHSLPELRRFFDLNDEEIRLPERKLEYGRSLSRREKDRPLFSLLYLLCFINGLIVFAGSFFLPHRLWLALGLISIIAPPTLALAFPQWYTLTAASGESKFRYGKRLYPVWIPMLCLPFVLGMRLPDVTYLSPVRHALLFAFPVVPLALLVWFLSPERKVAPKVLALSLACWIFLGCGTGLVINTADYYCAPPAMREQRRITQLEDRISSSGLHSCYVHLDNAGSSLTLPVTKSYYDTLTCGSFITVDYYNGTLGVPYAYVCEDWDGQ